MTGSPAAPPTAEGAPRIPAPAPSTSGGARIRRRGPAPRRAGPSAVQRSPGLVEGVKAPQGRNVVDATGENAGAASKVLPPVVGLRGSGKGVDSYTPIEPRNPVELTAHRAGYWGESWRVPLWAAADRKREPSPAGPQP
jgi:hypothetical protein